MIKSISLLLIFIFFCCGSLDGDYLVVFITNNTSDVIYAIRKDEEASYDVEITIEAGKRYESSYHTIKRIYPSDRIDYIKILDKDKIEKLSYTGSELDEAFIYLGKGETEYKYELVVTDDMFYPDAQ